MSLQKLTLATLGLLDDGRAAVAVDRAIAEAVADLGERGMDGKPREVMIKLKLVQEGEDRYTAHIEVGTKRPGCGTVEHPATVRKQRGEATLNFEEKQTADEPTSEE